MRAVRATRERLATTYAYLRHSTQIEPPVYWRCPSCQRVGMLGWRRGGVRNEPAARNVVKAPMPPEYRCRWCNEFSPRIQGDEIDLNDPAADAVLMLCLAPHRWPVIRWFRRSHNICCTPCPAEHAALWVLRLMLRTEHSSLQVGAS